jgi:hypothetical protein
MLDAGSSFDWSSTGWSSRSCRTPAAPPSRCAVTVTPNIWLRPVPLAAVVLAVRGPGRPGLPLLEGFQRHPNCDCTMIPTTLANPDFVHDPVDLISSRRREVVGLSPAMEEPACPTHCCHDHDPRRAPQGDPAPPPSRQAAGRERREGTQGRARGSRGRREAAAALQKQLDDIAAANLSDLEKAQKPRRTHRPPTRRPPRRCAPGGRQARHQRRGRRPVPHRLRHGDRRAQAAASWRGHRTAGKPDLSQGARAPPAPETPEQDFANFLGAQMSGRG